jgi:hypothetical protein
MENAWEKCKSTLNFVWKTSWEYITWGLRHRWEDNIKINQTNIGCKDVNWIELAQGQALVITVINVQVP